MIFTSTLKKATVLAAILLTAILLLSFVTGSDCVYADEIPDIYYESITNVGDNNYDRNFLRWGHPIYSHLTYKDGKYVVIQAKRAENDTGTLEVSYYNSKFDIESTKSIYLDLPMYGGFFETADNYYLFTGQKNIEQDGNKDVIRVTKYDKNWNRISSCGLCGVNTTTPFAYGSLRAVQDGNYLYVRTCHEMYADPGGFYHQANMAFSVDMVNMKIVQSDTDSLSNAYVSHSFNQFVAIDGHKLIALDHGDCFPRSICLSVYTGDTTTGKYEDIESFKGFTEIMHFAGEGGDNDTGASLNALEVSSSSYLIAGNSVVQDEMNLERKTRNVYVAVVDKNTKDLSFNWLTDFSEGEESASNPHLLKLGTDNYLIMWERSDKVFYTGLDGKGKRTGNLYEMPGHLSDCPPAIINGNICWYTFKDDTQTFYTIALNDLSSHNQYFREQGHAYEWTGTENHVASFKCLNCGAEKKLKTPTLVDFYWPIAGGLAYDVTPPELKVNETIDFFMNRYYEQNDYEESKDMIIEFSDPDCYVIDFSNQYFLTFKKSGVFEAVTYPKYDPSLKQTYVFRVDVRKLKKSMVSAVKDKTFTGSKITQNITVKYSGTVLKEGTDYTVKYKNNKNVGKATVTIKGKGRYEGTITRTFKIKPTKPTIKKPKAGKKYITVKWKAVSARMSKSRITGYQIQIARDKNFKKDLKKIKVRKYSNTSYKVEGLKNKKTYFVRVRTYKTVSGKTYYSSWSKVKKIKTK